MDRTYEADWALENIYLLIGMDVRMTCVCA